MAPIEGDLAGLTSSRNWALMYFSIFTHPPMESGRMSQFLMVITYVYSSPFFHFLLCKMSLSGWLEVTERKDYAQPS